MNFDFSEEQKLLQKTTHDYLQEHSPLAVARAVLESDASYSPELWKGAAEMGWLGVTIPEEHGGAGYGHLELALIAQEIGAVLAPIPFSSSVYLATEALLLAGSPEQQARLLPRLASGDAIGTFALAEGAGRVSEQTLGTRLSAGALEGTKLPVPDGDIADFAVVVARDGEGACLALVELDARGVEVTRVDSIDPSRSQARLELRGAQAERLESADQTGWSLVSHLLDRAAVLAAFEQLGGALRAFDITREFTLNRYAFGRPIASFQALKHRLADCYVELELARSNGYYGAWALASGSDELPLAACAARASACDAFELSTREMIQMHGGVGYTWEYDCHLFYRRAKLLSVALGSADHWRELLMQRLEN